MVAVRLLVELFQIRSALLFIVHPGPTATRIPRVGMRVSSLHRTVGPVFCVLTAGIADKDCLLLNRMASL